MSGSPITNPGILERNVLQMANTDVPVLSTFFGNKCCHPEIIKEPPGCFARRDIKLVKGITCTSPTLMLRIKSTTAFQKGKKKPTEKKESVDWEVHS